MNAIRIRTQIESTTLTLPELSAMMGKMVEIVVYEEAPQSQPSPAFNTGGAYDSDLMDVALMVSGALSRLA